MYMLLGMQGICLSQYRSKILVCIIGNLFLLCILHMSPYILYNFPFYRYNKILYKSHMLQCFDILNNSIDSSNNSHSVSMSLQCILYNYPHFHKKCILIHIFSKSAFGCLNKSHHSILYKLGCHNHNLCIKDHCMNI